MRILALDLGTHTGWAVRDANGVITYGTELFESNRYEGGGMRFLRFDKFIDAMFTMSRPDTVYYEEVRRHLGTDAAHLYGGFMAHLTALCEEHKIPYQGIPVGTIKKHITGKGNANKAAVIAAVEALGFNPRDDNAADALALLDFVLKMEGT